MTLPSSGPLSFSQVNVELAKASNALIGLNDTAVRNLAQKSSGIIAFSDLLGKTGVIRKTVSSNTTNLVLQNLFTAEEWTSSAPKEVVIAAGVTIGSANPAVAAVRTGAGAGGSVTLIDEGAIYGAGGVANSGAGGHAVETQIALIIDNAGEIRGGGAGGGKGGKGGTGGAGSTTNIVREPASGEIYQNMWSSGNFGVPDYLWGLYVANGQQTILWNYTPQNAPANTWNPPNGVTTFTVGGYTYYRGAFREQIDNFGQTQYFGIYRTYNGGTISTAGGVGGDGGNSGVGRGFNQTPTAGVAGANGAAGGTNAGAGGKGGMGGTGGEWGLAGSAGNTGATGAAGNAGAGLAGAAGAAGGTPGKAVNILAGGSVVWLRTGTRSGAF